MKPVIESPVPLEFKKVLAEGLSGELTISTTSNIKRIYIENGKLIHSESDLFDEKLGVILNLTGKVSDSQYDNISGLVHSVDKRVGNVLVQNNIITNDELKEAILYQARRIAISSFSITSGEIDFREGVLPDPSISRLKIPVEEIIYNGGRRSESVNYVSKEYYFNSPLFQSDSDVYFKMLSDEEKEIIEIVKKSENISNARLISRSGISPDKYWEIITVLFLLGIVEFSNDKKDKPTEEDIIGLIRLKNRFEKETPDIFSVLGINKDESATSIQRSYISLAQKYDPERFGSDLSPEIKNSARYVLQKLGSAFREIMNLKKKKDTTPEEKDSIPKKGPEDEISLLSDDKFAENGSFYEAHENFLRGKELFYENKFDEALILLKDAMRSGDSGYENYYILGLCQTNLPFFTDEAERNLKKAMELSPAKSEPVHALGRLYVELKKKKNAKKCFERAVKLEPGNIGAAQDLFKIKYPSKKKKRKIFSRR